MIVKLLAHTPDADRVCAAAARSCYSAKPAGELYDTMKDLAVNFAGAAAFNTAGYFYLKGRKKHTAFIKNFIPSKSD